MKTVRPTIRLALPLLLGLCLTSAPLALAQQQEEQKQPPRTGTAQGTEGYREAAAKMSHFVFQKSGDNGYIVPPGEDPALLQGTEKSFSRNQLQKLFANGRPDVEIFKILKQLPKKNSRQAKYFLRDRITQIVQTSSDNDAHECARTERLMCFVLNRSLEISDVIDSFADRRQPGILDQEVRVMKESLALAASYYSEILAFIHAPETEQTKAWTPKYREFGEKYAKIFMKANESVLASQAQYNAAFTILAYFQYDLMRDLNSDLNKEAAKTIYETLDQLPKPDEPDSSTSVQRLNNLRTLWDGYYTALEILHKFAPGSPAHPAVPVAAGSSPGAQDPAAPLPAEGARMYFTNGYRQSWVKRVDTESGLIYIAFKQDSQNTTEWAKVRATDLLRPVPPSTDPQSLNENDEVSNTQINAKGKIEAVLENGLIVVNWTSASADAVKSRTMTAALLCKRVTSYVTSYGTLEVGMKVWLQNQDTYGTLSDLYSNGYAVARIPGGDDFTGSVQDIRLK